MINSSLQVGVTGDVELLIGIVVCTVVVTGFVVVVVAV